MLNWLGSRHGLGKKRTSSETVEKVPKQILGGDAEKNDLTECATINDLTITSGHETPENHPLTILKGFSTVSPVLVIFKNRPTMLCFKWKSIRQRFNVPS